MYSSSGGWTLQKKHHWPGCCGLWHHQLAQKTKTKRWKKFREMMSWSPLVAAKTMWGKSGWAVLAVVGCVEDEGEMKYPKGKQKTATVSRNSVWGRKPPCGAQTPLSPKSVADWYATSKTRVGLLVHLLGFCEASPCQFVVLCLPFGASSDL